MFTQARGGGALRHEETYDCFKRFRDGRKKRSENVAGVPHAILEDGPLHLQRVTVFVLQTEDETDCFKVRVIFARPHPL